MLTLPEIGEMSINTYRKYLLAATIFREHLSPTP